jgi:hypothetical protein
MSSPIWRARKQNAPRDAAAEAANREAALFEFRCEKCKYDRHGGGVIGR